MIILKRWIRELLSPFVFLRFKNVWTLYDYICKTRKHRGICASVFSHYVDVRGGFIGLGAKFGNHPYMPHGLHGVFISQNAVIGKNAVIFQNVTIGSQHSVGSKSNGSPTIGDNCYIGAGASIIGNVTIGNNCRIGAGAVVYTDMPDNSVALCAPTRIIVKESIPDNRFFRIGSDGRTEYWNGNGFTVCEKEQ